MTNATIEFNPSSKDASGLTVDQLMLEDGSIRLIADLPSPMHIEPGASLYIPTGFSMGHSDGSVVCLIEVQAGRADPDPAAAITGTFLVPPQDSMADVVIKVINETGIDMIVNPGNGIGSMVIRQIAEPGASEIAGGGIEVTTPISYRPVHIDAAVKPTYATPNSSGFDLRADLAETVTIRPGERLLVPTGIRIAMPHGTEGQLRPRSGLAARHGVAAVFGTIDADYRGELKVNLHNGGAEPFDVIPGERIAQFVLAPVLHAAMLFTDVLDATERGEGGFGSTGR